MKKFTHIDEDLIKENLKLEEQFNTHYTESLQIVDQIKVALDDFAIKQQKDPGNWGFVGSVANVHDELREILNFLNINDENDFID